MTATSEGCASSTREDKLIAAGRAAAAEAERMWKLDIFDPPFGSKNIRALECLLVIEGIIKRNGWGFATPYKGNGPPQWCGMFGGDCWRTAGLDPSWLATFWASTYRLKLWATYRKFDQKSKPNPAPLDHSDRRLYVDLSKPLTIEPRAGDIVIVGDGDPDEGDHVTVNMGYHNGIFDTISGNGGGVGPKGNKREGISRRDYSVGLGGYRAMFLLRPACSDVMSIVSG